MPDFRVDHREDDVVELGRISSRLLDELRNLPDCHISHRVDGRAHQLIIDALHDAGLLAMKVRARFDDD